ncbi:YigZ family protein [Teredinibacter turnerae]|uniref:YigZ family protein n=1 Tax=Teredinibacter turnerae TaxID=2426 RepID=UPI000374CE7C|nr:YigZ family protein [Teredinibacter turnerae]
MTTTLGYTVLSAPSVLENEEKRSRFICLLSPVQNKADIQSALDCAREQYPAANHYCWAYVIGDANQPTWVAANDDGEPSGTAGRPILNVLQQREVGDILAVVVRYFGGVKLGAGGLVRAYSNVTSQALDAAQLKTVLPMTSLTVIIDYAHENVLRNKLAALGGTLEDVSHAEAVRCKVSVPSQFAAEFCTWLTGQTSGKSIIES